MTFWETYKEENLFPKMLDIFEGFINVKHVKKICWHQTASTVNYSVPPISSLWHLIGPLAKIDPICVFRSDRIPSKKEYFQIFVCMYVCIYVSSRTSKVTHFIPSLPDQPRLIQVIPSEPEWTQVNPSESNWIQLNPSEPKWTQVNPSEPKGTNSGKFNSGKFR